MDFRDDEPERLPPNSQQAEEAVIGSVILDRSLIGKLADIVTPEDFYYERHAIIFRAMLALHERQQPVDYLLLMEELERIGKLAQVGGTTYIAGLLGAVPTPIHAVHYAGVVAHMAVMRRLISAGGKIATLGYENAIPDSAEAVETARGLLRDVLPPAGNRGPVTLKAALSAYLEYADAMRAGDASVNPSVPTGLNDLDTILGGGMQRSDLLIVGARPSMGKTALSLNILCNVATKFDGTGLMFSLEMPIDQIVGRLLALHSGVEATTIRRGIYTDTEVRRIGLAVNSLADARIYVDDQGELTIGQIRDRARLLHQEHPLDFIVVDHIQLVRASGALRNQNLTAQVTETTRQLKAMARELRVPVMALSQLSRDVETRQNKVPELRDLRESGSSEQDADVVAFLYRDAYYNPESERQGLADLVIAKHRNGSPGKLTMIFNQRTMKYLDVEPY